MRVAPYVERFPSNSGRAAGRFAAEKNSQRRAGSLSPSPLRTVPTFPDCVVVCMPPGRQRDTAKRVVARLDARSSHFVGSAPAAASKRSVRPLQG